MSLDGVIERVSRAQQPLALLKRLAVDAGPERVIQLADEVPRRARSSLDEARRLARAASWLAHKVGDPHARARALRADGHVQSLGGRYRAALARYKEAVEAFTASGAEIEVAITDSGSLQPLIYCGEYDEAFARAARARSVFQRYGDHARLARLESNAGNIYFRQDRFEEALACYQNALDGFRASASPADVAVTLRNLATCLISLTRYDEALRVYEDARVYCESAKMPLMTAEADYNIGYLYFMRGDYQQALDLYAAARAFCVTVRDRYHHAPRALDDAQLDPEASRRPRALTLSLSAVRRLADLHAPAVAWQAALMVGSAHEALGQEDEAFAAYRRARGLLEELRSHLRGDELKITFLSDKLAIYEGLVAMALKRGAAAGRAEAAFGFIEEAKSRSFADLIAFRASELSAREPAGELAAAGVREARQQLHGYDHQTERETTGQKHFDPTRLARPRKDAGVREALLADRLRALRSVDADLADLHGGGALEVPAIRASLAPGVKLLEYYISRGMIRACVVGRDQLDIQELGPAADVAAIVRLLRFQLGKFRLHAEYLRTFGRVLLDATTSHLARLHQLLIEPVRDVLDADHLVIVPHGVLHYVPFHALHDRGAALIDRFAISYAPSARVHHLCTARPRAASDHSLVLGVGDTLAPLISREVTQLAGVLPNVEIGLAGDATSAQLRSAAARTARLVHIATHGFFRRDRPMMSSIKLSDGNLTVAD